MIADFVRGAAYARQGLSLVRVRGIRRHAVLPLLVNVLLFGGAIWLGASAFDGAMDRLLPGWLDVALVRAILWVVFAASIALIAFYTFTLLANLVAAPFNGLLAARTERHLRGQLGEEGRRRGLVADIAGSFWAELRKLFYLLGWSLPLLALFLVPGINLLAPLLWLVFGAWMLALEYVDCPVGNHGAGFPETRRLLGGRPALALGFGSVVMLMTVIPLLNLFVMPVAVAGATALYVDELAPGLRRPERGDGPGAAGPSSITPS